MSLQGFSVALAARQRQGGSVFPTGPFPGDGPFSGDRSMHADPAGHHHPLHAAFLTILPRLLSHARIQFRSGQVNNEESTAEMVALTWKRYLRLVQRGKDPLEFPTVLATFVARAVRAGRRLCGQDGTQDVLSPRAQRRHRFAVKGLPDSSTLSGNVFDEALRDNTRTPPDEQASFRLDFQSWYLGLSHRDRDIVVDMALGERTLDLARKYRLSASRISQKRRQFHGGWQRFCGEECEDLAATPC
jgi:hypothetical protein